MFFPASPPLPSPLPPDSNLSLEDKGLEKALIEYDLKPLENYVLWYNLVSVMVDGIWLVAVMVDEK